MKNLRLTISIIIMFVFQSLILVWVFFILKKIFIDSGSESLISQQEKMFLIAGFLIVTFVSFVFVVIIIRTSAKKQETIIKYASGNKVDDAAEKKKKNLEEQKRLSDIEKKRNKTINSLMQGLNNKLELKAFSEKLLANLAKQYELVQGIVFVNQQDIYKKSGAYALYREDEVQNFKEGVGIAGQVAVNKELINISNLPDKYLTVLSGLGSSAPANLMIFPAIYDNKTIGIIELATFVKMDKLAEQVLKVLSGRLGEQINKIIVATK